MSALSTIALRAASGAFILNSGINKLNLNGEAAEHLRGLALNAFPALENIEPESFAKGLSYGEIGLGAALLTPFLPKRLVALALTIFAGGLLVLYLRTPGMTQPDGIRPTREGTALAKDVWLLAIGLALLFDRKRRS